AGPAGPPDFSWSSQMPRQGLHVRRAARVIPPAGSRDVDPPKPRRPMKLKLLAILVLIVAGAGAIFVSIGGLPTSAASATTYLTSAAVVGSISNDIAATGTIAASTRYGLAFGTAAQQLTGTSTTAGSTPSSTG